MFKFVCKFVFKLLFIKYLLFSNFVVFDKRLVCCIDKLIKILFNLLNSVFFFVILFNFLILFGVVLIY